MTEATTITDTQTHANAAHDDARRADRKFVLQRVQPALLGLMDGSVSTLAPLFATAFALANNAHGALTAFLVGLAASVGAGISMGLSEALSDDGTVTGRGNPLARGSITGIATTIGGMLHTFPFLIGNVHIALHIAYVVVVFELLGIAYIRFRFMRTPLYKTVIQVIIGGAIVLAIGIGLGMLGAAS
jgi:VIT1/CCC1 family predicted Fe2+/Mn2+ transporter